MPITGASGGIIGADNTPAAAGDGCVTAVTSTGCYTPTSTTATVIVVGGGGGAGTGGGGAGGVMVVSCHPLPTSNVPVTIGAGGAASQCFSACNGSNSVFGASAPITAIGGGGAGGSNSGPHKGKDGGSGGGGGDDGSAVPGGTLTTNQPGSQRAGFSGGKGDHGTGGGGGGAGGSGGKRGVAGFGRTLVPLGVPECIGEKGFVCGGGSGWNYNYGECISLAVISACRTATPYAKFPYAVQGAAFGGGMGGGGAADAGRIPNRHPLTPTCAVTNATAGIANTGGGGGSGKGAGTSQAGGSGVVIVITPASATLNSGVYNIKEQYAAVRGSWWI